MDVYSWLSIAGAAAIVIFWIDRERNRKKAADDAARRQRWAEQEAKIERDRTTRRLARERARIAYPELMDATEAGRDPIGPFGGYEAEDAERIRSARKLFAGEDERLRMRDQAAYEDEALTVYVASLLLMPYGARDIPKKGEPSEFLNGPARIIDCGEAGQIELFTADQVQAARDQSGRTDYVDFLQRYYEAPNVARRVIERVKARDEMIERQKRDAKDAITTKIDDLPPLPPNRE